MTDQTACRPGTIRTIGLPVSPDYLTNALARFPEGEARVVGHGDHLDVCAPETEQRTTLTIPGDPKMVREALCVAEGATLRNVDEQNRHGAREVLGALIQECDRHRPLGPDGKHGDRHTATCGCDDLEAYATALCGDYPDGDAAIEHTYLVDDEAEEPATTLHACTVDETAGGEGA